MRNKIIDIKDNDSLQNAAHVLKNGGILVFPTDTVYGIGCLLNYGAIIKLYKIKNRPLSQPTAILLTKEQYHFCHSSVKSGINMPENIYKDFLKGKVTSIFPRILFKIEIPAIILQNNTIGIRIPNDKWLEKLIDIVGPIVASSANKKGERPPKNFKDIDQQIIEKADMAIQAENNLPGKPSIVYDLHNNHILRD